jgi:hypothetical protein
MVCTIREPDRRRLVSQHESTSEPYPPLAGKILLRSTLVLLCHELFHGAQDSGSSSSSLSEKHELKIISSVRIMAGAAPLTLTVQTACLAEA